MKKFTSCLLVVLCLTTLTFGTTSCVSKSNHTPTTIEQPTTKAELGQQFIDNSWKTYQSVDIAMDAVFKTLGDMYKNGQITKAQADTAIAMGKPVKASMKTVKSSLALMAQTKESIDAKKSVINNLVTVVKNFNSFKNDASNIYKSVTGMPLVVPNLSLFTELIEVL